MAPTIETIRILPSGYLRSGDAARYIGHAERTLANWRVQGKGPKFVKRGGRVLYDRTALDEWLVHGDGQGPR